MPQIHTAPKESFGQGIPLGKDSLGASPSKGILRIGLTCHLYPWKSYLIINLKLIFRELIKLKALNFSCLTVFLSYFQPLIRIINH